MFKFNKKRVLALAAVAALAVAGIAYAYWTTTGSGTGSGSVASSNGTLTLHGVVADALTPGGSSSVTLTADNLGTSSLQVGTVTLDGVEVDALHSGCVVGDFTMPDVPGGDVVPAGVTGQTLTHHGTITMADTAISQDACKGATLTLNLLS
jgi:hypothetical protein